MGRGPAYSLRMAAVSPQELSEVLDRATLSAAERRAIEQFVTRLGEELGDDLLAVWLYGSRARGEPAHPESDVDLMVIAEGGKERYYHKVFDLRDEAVRDADLNPFFFSTFLHDPEWLRGRREIRSFFIQEIDRDKLVLAGSTL